MKNKENKKNKEIEKEKKVKSKTTKEDKKKDKKESKIAKKEKDKKKKRKKENTPTFSLVEVIIIVLITVIVVSVSSGLLIFNNYENLSFNKENENSKYIKEFEQSYNKITEDYLERIDKQELIDAAIEGMFNYLGDPYSSYLNEEETEELTEKLQGTYDGIGIEITDDTNGITVVRVFEGPAKEAGVKKGDIITKIDDENLSEKNASYLSNYIKYKSQDKVTLTVTRDNKNKEIKISKKEIDYPSVSSDKYGDTGYIYLNTFAKTTASQFEDALKDLEKDGIKNLVLDLRGNTGGYLNTAFDIAEQFLPKGKVVYQLQEKGKKTKYKTTKANKKDYELVILIDGRSASASEVLALALKGNYKATLVGEKSYGKGSVQQTSELDNGSMVKYTTAKWLSPKGESIDGVGITPDVNIIYSSINDEGIDNQLEKALELLK